MNTKSMCKLLLFLFLAGYGVVSAQTRPAWQQTGTLEAVIAGNNHVMHSYSTTVPEDAAAKTDDPAARALLEKLAGSEQNSASWMVTSPLEMSGMILVPAMMFVSIDTRTSEDPSAKTGQIDLSFGLDMETLELETDSDVEVRYFPGSWDLDDYYALTEGALTLDSVEASGENTLTITGRISGTLSYQESYSIEHNPADTLSLEATFRIERVTGSAPLTEVLGW